MFFKCVTGRGEERHDAVARVLIHRALEAVHTFAQNGKETVQNRVPGFRVHVTRKLHGSFDIREQHRDLFVLAFDRRAGMEDLVGEVLGGVVGDGARLRCRASSDWTETPQPGQNFALGPSASPQLTQARINFAPHDSQNLALSLLECWQDEQFIIRGYRSPASGLLHERRRHGFDHLIAILFNPLAMGIKRLYYEARGLL